MKAFQGRRLHRAGIWNDKFPLRYLDIRRLFMQVLKYCSDFFFISIATFMLSIVNSVSVNER